MQHNPVNFQVWRDAGQTRRGSSRIHDHCLGLVQSGHLKTGRIERSDSGWRKAPSLEQLQESYRPGQGAQRPRIRQSAHQPNRRSAWHGRGRRPAKLPTRANGLQPADARRQLRCPNPDSVWYLLIDQDEILRGQGTGEVLSLRHLRLRARGHPRRAWRHLPHQESALSRRWLSSRRSLGPRQVWHGLLAGHNPERHVRSDRHCPRLRQTISWLRFRIRHQPILEMEPLQNRLFRGTISN